MGTNNNLTEVSKMLGTNSNVKYVRRIGRLSNNLTGEASDVLGFDNIVFIDGTCYEYYAANPPLIGMTQPVPVPYPYGLAIFEDYKIDYKEAIKLFHSGNWGSKFTSISISQPLYPGVNDPSWYICSELGIQVVINANTGEIHTSNINDSLLAKV